MGRVIYGPFVKMTWVYRGNTGGGALYHQLIMCNETPMKSVSVFCGSTFGNSPAFVEAAKSIGRNLAEREITLIYGGANVGLMGAVADAALASGGKVIGVLPQVLKDKEVAHPNLTELILCESMHERKAKMFELSEGFVALPGGFGTLEEVCEILTWRQIGLHKFPVGFLNIEGYYNHLDDLFSGMEAAKLLKPENRSAALFHDNVSDLLEAMTKYNGFSPGA